MSMAIRRFFWDGVLSGDRAVLTDQESHHIASVLRLKPGDPLLLCDGQGYVYTACLEMVSDQAVTVTVGEKRWEQSEPRLDTTLYLAYTKGDRMEYAIQKTVELGVSRIGLYASERCVTGFSENKLTRYRRIAMEACKQSGRARMVQVEHVGDFGAVLLRDRNQPLKLFCYENAMQSIRYSLEQLPEHVCILCGPEGGFTQQEAVFAAKTGWQTVSLGKRILRNETAPVVALSLVLFQAHEI